MLKLVTEPNKSGWHALYIRDTHIKSIYYVNCVCLSILSNMQSYSVYKSVYKQKRKNSKNYTCYNGEIVKSLSGP